MQTQDMLFVVGMFFNLLLIFFLLMLILVLRKSRSEVSIAFSGAISAFIIGSLFCALDFYARAGALPGITLPADYMGLIGTLAYLWAPFGIFISGKFILHGTHSWKEIVPLAVFIGLVIISIVYLVTVYDPIIGGTLKPSRGTWFGTVVISIILVIALVYYRQIYQKAPDVKNNILFLMIGIIIGIGGLLATLISSGDPDIIPMEFNPIFALTISFGVLIASFAFTNLPLHLSSKEGGAFKSSN